VEVNEAFAPQVLASIRRLGIAEDVVNTDGGAIALGHPLGATGIRLLLMLISRLERHDQHRGVATLCVGVGQGMALAVEKV
jgi:acetyl-CoA acetyltransferase